MSDCPDCDGQGKLNPSPRGDPQCEIDCPACQGEGRLPDDGWGNRDDTELVM